MSPYTSSDFIVWQPLIKLNHKISHYVYSLLDLNKRLLSFRTAVSTFKDFELASTQQRPDVVLRRRRKEQQLQQRTLEAKHGKVTVARPTARRFMRLAVMGLTVALGAAALAMVNSALEWAPKLDILFP